MYIINKIRRFHVSRNRILYEIGVLIHGNSICFILSRGCLISIDEQIRRESIGLLEINPDQNLNIFIKERMNSFDQNRLAGPSAQGE